MSQSFMITKITSCEFLL